MNQLKKLEDGLKGLRVDETGYLIVPHGVEINPLGSGGKIWPVRQIIQQWQHLIRQRMFTDFIALGSGSSGSRALSGRTDFDVRPLSKKQSRTKCSLYGIVNLYRGYSK